LRHLRTVRQLELPAPITTGTFTTTRGSNKVLADADATVVLSQACVYRHIRFGTHSTWYEITSVGTSGTFIELTIASPYTESSGEGVSYTIVERYHTLPEDVRWATAFVHMRLHRELRTRTDEELSLLAPGRSLVGPPPQFITEAPHAASGLRRVESYPYSTQPETLHYVAWSIPPTLEYTDDVPVDVDPVMLKEGVLIDIMRWEAAQATKAGKADAAALLRNDARAQYTQWTTRDIPAATATERVFDDVQVILETTGGSVRGSFRDIFSARDQVWARNL
jgi:hypothetical protein